MKAFKQSHVALFDPYMIMFDKDKPFLMRNMHVIVSETVAAVLNFIRTSVLLNVYSTVKSLGNQAHVNACIRWVSLHEK